ncbi:S41 family peptidase [Evansella halocellulosilytica]|uniref:S41 family peptidase n=1 Tax=Evansella halocellulosilytica TaxID=2011013 RepID=UPI000BB78C64|nr:S41 family peptidase [Evansella halocellulosilytica]
MQTESKHKEIIQKAIALIDEHYVFQEKKAEIIDRMKGKMDQGTYGNCSNDDALAKALTTDLVEISEDKHLYVKAIQEKETIGKERVDEWMKKEKEDERNENFGFIEVKVMDGNVGYLRISQFMNPDRGIDTANAAMKLIENAAATVIDVRNNGGGYGGLAEYVSSYFFPDEPKLLSTTVFKEKEMTSFQTFTHPFVVGKRRLNHQLYIIVNEKTASAAEYFAYVLQANKKAVIVGGTSAGAANRNTYFALSDKLRISISTGTPIIEATGTNWEGKGVIPDLPCKDVNVFERIYEHIKSQS